MKSNDINIFVLTHKEFEFPKKNIDNIYFPILCNSTLLDDDFDYLKDNIGDNISDLNKYYAELTGQYWAWKNSDADIIGFCHYRRYFANNFLLTDLLSENEIKEDLENHDIILPQITHLNKTVGDYLGNYCENSPMGAKPEDINKLRKIIDKDYPDYIYIFLIKLLTEISLI